MLLVTVVVAAVLLVAVILYRDRIIRFISGDKSPSTPEIPTPEELNCSIIRLEKELDEMRRRNAVLEKQLAALLKTDREDKISQRNRMQQLNNDIDELKQKYDEFLIEADRYIESLVERQSQTHSGQAAETQYAMPKYPRKRYARFADFNRNGFLCADLAETGDDSIFEIIEKSTEEAVFHLIPDNDIRVQLFPMLNHVVKPVCDIVVESQSPQKIEDVSLGKLEKADDCWGVTIKASIKLV